MNELESTAYQIDKSKFFCSEPNEKLTMKKDAESFYSGAYNGNPPRSIRKITSHLPDSQENTPHNIRRSKLRSPVKMAGNTIVRSSSVNKIHK